MCICIICSWNRAYLLGGDIPYAPRGIGLPNGQRDTFTQIELEYTITLEEHCASVGSQSWVRLMREGSQCCLAPVGVDDAVTAVKAWNKKCRRQAKKASAKKG
ncbi:hypothetical protein PTKIN_Ptkin16aG0496600 [Pterospermum kingtungense]